MGHLKENEIILQAFCKQHQKLQTCVARPSTFWVKMISIQNSLPTQFQTEWETHKTVVSTQKNYGENDKPYACHSRQRKASGGHTSGKEHAMAWVSDSQSWSWTPSQSLLHARLCALGGWWATEAGHLCFSLCSWGFLCSPWVLVPHPKRKKAEDRIPWPPTATQDLTGIGFVTGDHNRCQSHCCFPTQFWPQCLLLPIYV